jgi:hypothetical protein
MKPHTSLVMHKILADASATTVEGLSSQLKRQADLNNSPWAISPPQFAQLSKKLVLHPCM